MASEPIDPRATHLLNQFLAALQIPDPDESANAVLPLVHVSLKTNDRTDLTRDLRSFSFKKANENAKFYAVPVSITRVRTMGTTGIGFGETAENGKVVDYFIAKNAGVNGMPAPIKVFFPASGGHPTVSYMGSL
jgi:hypothetical protein